MVARLCDGTGAVTIDELIAILNIALGNMPLASGAAGDIHQSGEITIDEVVGAVGPALNGCK